MSELLIKWRQDYEFLECADAESKREKLDTPIWHTFDNSDLVGKSRDTCISLFLNGTPVVIRQDDKYVVNSRELLDQYQRAGKEVMLLSDCEPSASNIIDAGFCQP